MERLLQRSSFSRYADNAFLEFKKGVDKAVSSFKVIKAVVGFLSYIGDLFLEGMVRLALSLKVFGQPKKFVVEPKKKPEEEAVQPEGEAKPDEVVKKKPKKPMIINNPVLPWNDPSVLLKDVPGLVTSFDCRPRGPLPQLGMFRVPLQVETPAEVVVEVKEQLPTKEERALLEEYISYHGITHDKEGFAEVLNCLAMEEKYSVENSSHLFKAHLSTLTKAHSDAFAEVHEESWVSNPADEVVIERFAEKAGQTIQTAAHLLPLYKASLA